VKSNDGFTLNAEGFKLESDLIVGATGRIPNTDKLDLEKAGIKYTNKGIQVNDHLQTTNKRVYAIGDVLDKKEPKLTPIAGFEARYVASVLNKDNSEKIIYPAMPTLV